MKDFLNKLTEERVLITFFVIPLFLIGRIMVRSYYGFLPFSWEETITLVMIEGASVLLLFFFLDKEEALNGTILSLSVFILFLNDLLGNTIDNVIYNIVISTIVIIVGIFSIVESILTMKRKMYDNVERLIKVMVFTFGLIVSIFFIESVIFDFGSQWIWMSVIPSALLFYLLAYLFDGQIRTLIFSNKIERSISGVLNLLSFVLIIVGIVSTLYQFWFSIIFGYVFWKIFITTIISIIGIIIIVSIFRKITKRKKEKRERIEAKKREDEEKKRYEMDEAAAKKREEERIGDLNLLKDNLKSMSEYTPQDVYRAIRNLSPSEDFELFHKIFSEFDFTKLITISIGHEQFSWNNQLVDLFKLVIRLVSRTKEDEKLLVLSKKIVDLTKEVEKYPSFYGYSGLNSYDSYIELKSKSERILKNLEK